MNDALVYSIPAWSKDVDPLFASDRSMLLETPSATDFYSSRRMSDSALTADTTTTTTDPNSPATEPDVASPPLDPARKPSLPGIGALTPLLDSSEPAHFARRASLPTLTADMSLSRSPSLSRPNFRPSQLSPYTFPGTPGTPPLDSSYSALGSAASSVSSFPSPSPFASPLSTMDPLAPGSFPDSSNQHHPPSAWSPSLPPAPPAPPSPRGSPKRRRTPESASIATSASTSTTTTTNPPTTTAAGTPAQPDGQPARRPRGKLPKHTTDLLKEWLHAHSEHPYPSEDEKRDLCARTKLSMSQVSNWMINARRRILAPAKPQTVSATTTEPYRGMPRPISSLYPSPHLYPAGMVRRPDAVGLYDTGPYGYDTSPRYQAQPMYPVPSAPERRLAYPASTVGYGHMADFTPQYGPSPLYIPGSSPQQRDSPRYFASPSESSL